MRRRARTVLRWAGLALLVVIVVYLVGRAVVEVVTVDPHRRESYEQDWGGPHYLGVLAVHAGPGLLALAALAFWVRRATRGHRRARRGP